MQFPTFSPVISTSEPNLDDASATMYAALAPVTRSLPAATTDMLQSSPANYAAMPAMGMTPSGTVGTIAQTPEGNVSLPVTPAGGASPTEELASSMQKIDTAVALSTGSPAPAAVWRNSLRMEAGELANFVSSWATSRAEQYTWRPFITALVGLSLAASSETQEQLRARLALIAIPAGVSAYSDVVDETRARFDALAALIPAAESGGGFTWPSGMGLIGMGGDSSTGSTGAPDMGDLTMIGGGAVTGEDVVEANEGAFPGGTVTEHPSDVDATPVVPAPSSGVPAWVWVLGGAVALAAVGGAVYAVRRK